MGVWQRFSEEELLACIKQLVVVVKECVPKNAGESLYLRPTHIGTQARPMHCHITHHHSSPTTAVTLTLADGARGGPVQGLVPLCHQQACLRPPHRRSATAVLSAHTLRRDSSPSHCWSTTATHAPGPVRRLRGRVDGLMRCQGGTGDTKCGANYAQTILPQSLGNFACSASRADHRTAKGYDQCLWVFGQDHVVTEAGTMNFFMFWRNESGVTELVTPPLDGTILEGVTRRTVIDLATQARPRHMRIDPIMPHSGASSPSPSAPSPWTILCAPSRRSAFVLYAQALKHGTCARHR